MSETYEKIVIVNKDDLDELDHVNNVRYVQWIQDISKEHWIHSAPETVREGLSWVVLHHDITYKSASQLDDVILIRTYIEESRGATCRRVVEMHNADTKILLVRSNTEWCLLNNKSLKPIRISEEIRQIFS